MQTRTELRMKKIFIRFIRFYQKYISVNTKARCKYYPTCSNYAIEAITEHGAFVGFFMAVWRILRCNPFSKGGYDPVPPKRKKDKKER